MHLRRSAQRSRATRQREAIQGPAMGTALLKSGAFALDCLLRGTAHRKVRSGSGVYFDDLARGLIEDKEARPLASRLEGQ